MTMIKQNIFPAIAVAATTLLGLKASSSATLTYDLRVTALNGVPLVTPTKNLQVAPNDAVTFTIYAMVTGTAGDSALEGVQQAVFSLVSSTAGTTKGSFGQATINSGFPSAGSLRGTPVDTNADGLFDRLGPGTTASSQNTAANSDVVALKDAPPQYTGTAIANGQEFTLATTVFTVAQAGSSLSITVVPSVFVGGVGAGRFSQIWAENAANNTTTQNRQSGSATLAATSPNTGDVSAGTGVTLIAVPEPSAFGMIFLGAMGVVGFRRVSNRRF